MATLWERIRALVRAGKVRISSHGYDELVEDDIMVRDVIMGIDHGQLIEEYPEYPKGPCVLVLQRDKAARPIHAVWGIPKARNSPAVLVTAYRPDQERWSEDFLRRKR